MPAIAELLAKRSGVALDAIQEVADVVEREVLDPTRTLDKRVFIPCCSSGSPQGLREAVHSPEAWSKSNKYALAWVYFCAGLLVILTIVRWTTYFFDQARIKRHIKLNEQNATTESPDTDYSRSILSTGQHSTQAFFPKEGPLPQSSKESKGSPLMRPVYGMIGLIRYIFYRPIPNINYRKHWRPIVFPSLAIILIVIGATALVLGYDMIPQPWYWKSIKFGSPPIAIRAGMIAVAMIPWIIALSMKANFISVLTGLGHERLNVLHRWAAYICLMLSLIHTVPFYLTPINRDGGRTVFYKVIPPHMYVYATGLAALVPLIFLCVHSLPPLRRMFYEVFVMAHVPVSIIFFGFLFWHCHNYLTSWDYLFATLAIWLLSYGFRLFYLNWSHPYRVSYLIGEEAAVTLMPENAIKVTIPTQMKWKPGQYVYLRMPGVSVFENHPFTIASLCSDDYPSEYGDEYKDMVLVFRPFAGFTKKLLESALDHGPWHTYRTFLDGPYGGMRRPMHSFDNIVMIAGGSGITAVVSQLLDLIHRMREGQAVTKSVQLVWALKRPETMEWFKEELQICRQYAPLDAVRCQFYITAAKRQTMTGKLVSAQTPTRPVSMVLHDKVNDVFQNIASNRFSTSSAQRNSALIHAEAQGDPEKEKQLRDEDADRLRPLPEAHLKSVRGPSPNRLAVPGVSHALAQLETPREAEEVPTKPTPHMPPHPSLHEKRRSGGMSIDISAARQSQATQMQQLSAMQEPQNFDFGFPSTPTEFQKNLMRFAFMPAAIKAQKSGWSTEWGRPDIPYMLREMSREWKGRRTCVYVCGPPSMRVDVSNTVASLQSMVLSGKLDEVFLHAENYAL